MRPSGSSIPDRRRGLTPATRSGSRAPAFQALSGAKPGFQVRHGAAPEEWLADLRRDCAKGTAVLFKASRAMRFEDVAAALQMRALS